MLFILASLALVCGCSNTKLPAKAEQFVAATFPTAKIVRVHIEHEHGGVEYEVRLNNGAKIDFDANNQWENIDCEDATIDVPTTLLHDSIAAYLSDNYPNVSVIEVDRDLRRYEVKLLNDVKLLFDTEGRHLRTKLP